MLIWLINTNECNKDKHKTEIEALDEDKSVLRYYMVSTNLEYLENLE